MSVWDQSGGAVATVGSLVLRPISATATAPVQNGSLLRLDRTPVAAGPAADAVVLGPDTFGLALPVVSDVDTDASLVFAAVPTSNVAN